MSTGVTAGSCAALHAPGRGQSRDDICYSQPDVSLRGTVARIPAARYRGINITSEQLPPLHSVLAQFSQFAMFCRSVAPRPPIRLARGGAEIEEVPNRPLGCRYSLGIAEDLKHLLGYSTFAPVLI
jgi:hypothetical protein